MAESDGGGVRRLLFVCTGNTCRSPMAEAAARAEARERGIEVACRSAGIAAGGGTASAGAREVADEADLDLSDHTSTQLDSELVAWADLVLCMGTSHRWEVERRGGEEKTRLITEFLPEDDERRGRPILDPVGGGPEVYRKTLTTLREAVDGLLDRLAGDEAAGDA